MRTIRKRILVPSALVWATSVLAVAQDKDVPGSKDHPLISRYPGSVVTRYMQKEYDEFNLPLVKSTNQHLAKAQHLEGKITRIEYRAPRGRSTLEVFRNYQMALNKAGFETLFTCAREECSNRAHGVSLYPGHGDMWSHPSDNPRYLSAKLSRPEGDAYVSLMVQYDPADVTLYVIEMKPMEAGLVTVDAASLAGDITRTGHAPVYGIYFDTGKADVKPESDAALKEIAKLLEQEPKLKLYVVGHTDNVGTLAANMDLSKRRANAVVQALTTKYGVAVARLHSEGVGPLTPVASNAAEEGRAKNRRVELVAQ